MAGKVKAKISTVKVFKLTPKKRRPGVHAKTKTSKTKTSKNKGSKNYKKPLNNLPVSVKIKIFEGIRYEFVSQNHLEQFKANSEKYEPNYGGWCAYAMGATGEKVEIENMQVVTN